MKKLLMSALVAVSAAFGFGASAQQPGMQLPQVPMDSAVVMGTLPNGLTYYIRHNDYPKGQADFYIAQKVGSVLEEDNQRGLAHFLEHMCFNGTKNFPGNSLVSWLESIGVKFGYNLNAYTGTDETVYNITNVPTNRVEVLDSCMLILHDWANELLLEPEEIDKERSVIHEEWRSRNNGTQRILEEMLPVIYPGSRYGYRMPIGTMEVVDNFPYQALRDYYEKWYRPDLQGLIIVGDIDVARTEAKVKEMFSDIEMPANAAERVTIEVPDTPGVIYAVGKDKEQSNAMTYLIWKYDGLPREIRSTVPALVMDFATTMINDMMNQRLSDMMSQPDAPFAVAQAEIGNYMLSDSKQMFATLGIAKEGDIRPTIGALYREVLRAKRGGFTQSEFDRAKQDYMSRLEKSFNNRNTQETGALTQKFIRNFIDNTPAADISTLYPMMQQISAMVDINTVNGLFNEMVGNDNRVIMAFLPESEQYVVPTEAELAEVIAAIDAEEIDAFVDNTRTDPLIPSLPKPGKIVKTETDSQWGATIWTLSNGVKVMIKPTNFKDDEILMRAVAPQGMSRDLASITPADFLGYDVFEDILSIGSYNNTDLQKYLTGKQVGVSPNFGIYSRAIGGNTTPKDLPTLMELVYGFFTAPNFDAAEFDATKSRYVGLLKNQEVNPQFQFSADLRKALYKSPYLQALTAETLEASSLEGILALTKAQMTNAADYTFVFVGNVDLDALKPLAEQYLATLPANAKKATKPVKDADPALGLTPGSGVSNFTFKMENPQTWCAILEFGNMDYNSRNAKLAYISGEILSARLLKTVREEMGAVYSIGASGGLQPQYGLNAVMQTAFPMNPDQKEKVLEVIKGEFAAMAENVTDEELSKVKEYLLKDYKEGRERNGSWLGYISGWLLSANHVDMISDAEQIVNSITPADVQNYVKQLNEQNNYRVVLLDPEQ